MSTDVLGDRYRDVDVPVEGGDLHVGIWDAATGEATQTPTVLAVHGITASHLCWAELAAALPQIRLVAPDLRGRGRSRDLPGPYGMARHADDLAAAVEALGVRPAVTLGHSMGGFVTAVFHERHPALCGRPVLIDGGLPLLPPPGMSVDELIAATLGPAQERLAMTFPDADAYRSFWRQHPAFAHDWTPAVEAYVDSDLVRTEDGLRAASRYEAVAGDTAELSGGTSLLTALDALPDPTPWLLAPRGLLDQVPPLYPEPARREWVQRYPQLRPAEIDGVNHYTIVMSARGVEALAATVTEQL